MIEIVHQLRKARGTNKKLRILKDHENNEQWRKFLYMVYNSELNYYTGPPNDMTFLSPGEVDNFDLMFHGLNNLANKKYVGNAARAVAKQLSQTFGELPRLVLNGSIKAGVSVKTINKAYPGLIPTFEVMLAKDVPITRYPILSSIKYDGVRLITRVEGGMSVSRTRNGKEFYLPSLEKAMRKQADGVYDGELVLGNGLQAHRTKITGLVNKVLKGTLPEIYDHYTYAIFDWVPLEDWDRQDSDLSYGEKWDRLNKGLLQDNIVMLTPQIALHSEEEVDLRFEDVILKGYEGLILRYPWDPYLWMRSEHLIKKKAIKEAILTCVDIQPGTGKYEGMIGSLICEGTVEGYEVKVKVGTGLSDFDRGRVDFVGSDIEVDYNDLVRAKDADYHSLFLPRFKRKCDEL